MLKGESLFNDATALLLFSAAVTIQSRGGLDRATALQELAPVLPSLTAAGDELPKGLQLLLTYPFPENVGDSVQGDYTNLSASIDLNLTDLLGNLLSPTAGTGAASTKQSTADKYIPIIPGSSG